MKTWIVTALMALSVSGPLFAEGKGKAPAAKNGDVKKDDGWKKQATEVMKQKRAEMAKKKENWAGNKDGAMKNENWAGRKDVAKQNGSSRSKPR